MEPGPTCQPPPPLNSSRRLPSCVQLCDGERRPPVTTAPRALSSTPLSSLSWSKSATPSSSSHSHRTLLFASHRATILCSATSMPPRHTPEQPGRASLPRAAGAILRESSRAKVRTKSVLCRLTPTDGSPPPIIP
jgi:hypothetical protein